MCATVLIIDDDSDYRASARALLESDGHEVQESPSGKEGVEAARKIMPDLIVLDIMMESPYEGYSVVQNLKAIEAGGTGQIPILMVSSIQEDPATLFPMSGEVPMITPDAYMTKPLNPTEFLGTVKRLLPGTAQ
jgi:CheY-like chemotaxis protein